MSNFLKLALSFLFIFSLWSCGRYSKKKTLVEKIFSSDNKRESTTLREKREGKTVSK